MTAARASCSLISPSGPGNSAGVFTRIEKRGKNCNDFTRTRPLRDRAQGTGPRAAGYRIHAQLRDLRHRVQQSEKASRPHGGTHPHLRRGTTGRRTGGDDPRPVRGGRHQHRARFQRKGFRLVRRQAGGRVCRAVSRVVPARKTGGRKLDRKGRGRCDRQNARRRDLLRSGGFPVSRRLPRFLGRARSRHGPGPLERAGAQSLGPRRGGGVLRNAPGERLSCSGRPPTAP